MAPKKPSRLAAIQAAAADEEDKLSDVVMDESAQPSRQASTLPSAQASEDEVVADDAEEEESDGSEDEQDELDEDGHVATNEPSPAKKERASKKEERAAVRQEKKAKKATQEGKLAARKAGVDTKKLSDSIKRFSYLLGQTDLFSHFCNLKKERDPNFAKMLEEAESKVKDRKGKAAQAAGSRRRKSEKEEDAELLKEEVDEAADDDDAAFVFTESPACEPSVAAVIATDEKAPVVKGGTMRDYQVQGLNWMVGLHHNGINGILADEMGLGKTLQTISFLGYLKFIRGISGPHLVVVPKSTLDNWYREISTWVPGFKTVMLKGTKEERADILAESILPQDFDICLSSYEICQREKSSLKKISWEYIVIDEAHRIKNVNSILSQIVRLFHSTNRLLITGTPLQNDLHELWALLNFLLPDVFSNVQDFDSWFTSQKSGDEEKDGDVVVQQLHKVLRPFLLRRVKVDVEKTLLPKREINVYVPLTEMQRKWYRSILEKDIDAVNGIGSKKEGKTRLLNIVMQLRKCCNHPYLFDGAEPGPPFTTDEHLVFNSGKMIVLDKLLKSMKAKGSRVLIFSQMSRVLDILEDYCQFRKFEYCRLDGGTVHEERMAAIDAYNKPDSEKFIFLLTTRAGGLGINLTTADIVVLFDSDWNPQADLQAMDRAHRIGQKKQVFVFRFVTENAVEEKVLERAAQKLRLDQIVIQQGRAAPPKNATSKDEILEMIQHGAEKIINAKEDLTIDDDIDEILRRGEERTQALNQKYSSLNIHDLANFTSDTTTQQWEGEQFGGKKKIGALWIEPTKRERKGNYSVDGYYRDAMNGPRRAGPSKAPQAPGVKRSDYQFFPPRYHELARKETLYFQKEQGYIVPLGEDKKKTPEQLEAERKAEQDQIDAAVPLTEAEEAEKEALSSEGFDTWHKKHYQAFIRGCEQHGKTNYEGIHKELPEKTVEEIAQYGAVFWQRYKEIEDWERQLSKIEAAENKRDQNEQINKLLTEKVKAAAHPYQQLAIPYTSQTKGKSYTEEEDRFLLVHLEKYKLGTEGVYEMIKRDMVEWPSFRFDWFSKSRLPIEISRRCTTLVQLIQKEAEDAEAKRTGKPVKRATAIKGAGDSDASTAPKAKPRARASAGTARKRKAPATADGTAPASTSKRAKKA